MSSDDENEYDFIENKENAANFDASVELDKHEYFSSVSTVSTFIGSDDDNGVIKLSDNEDDEISILFDSEKIENDNSDDEFIIESDNESSQSEINFRIGLYDLPKRSRQLFDRDEDNCVKTFPLFKEVELLKIGINDVIIEENNDIEMEFFIDDPLIQRIDDSVEIFKLFKVPELKKVNIKDVDLYTSKFLKNCTGPVEKLYLTEDLPKIKIKDVDLPFDPPVMSDITGPILELYNNELKKVKIKDVRVQFECLTCFEECFDNNVIACFDYNNSNPSYERHRICVDCVCEYAKNSITGTLLAPGGIGLTCSIADCENVLLMSEFGHYLDLRVFDPLMRRMQNEAINSARIPNLVECPECNVKYVIDSNVPFYDCECGRRQCHYCHRLYDHLHENKTCDEVERIERITRIEHDIAPRLSDAVIRVCPRCKTQFMKENGCNKMTCQCGIFLCYFCVEIIPGYEHFCECGGDRVVGVPCNRCGKTCPLHYNAELVDNERINQIRANAGL